MIFVILGTHELPFTRLVKEIERLKKEGFIKEEIIVQSGHTNYSSDLLTIQPFMSYEEMESIYDRARLIITHAGTGSVITGLKKNKKVIAVARLKEYGEHNDNHQLELVDVFKEKGHILEWDDRTPLQEVMKSVEEFSPKPFVSGKEKMIKLIDDFIEKNS
ncbi:PssE/Cps14G family polysaccharide biosynthesis glycosyltransferase [Virgibacillus kekensis]|uniref:PssE/Cps14G family polysaccharide biosynthesis glycosyltransferase n=1 Tax=Virgibacillus kekensis TaxID=202261 RepID=A0ABV9DI70_9BACI